MYRRLGARDTSGLLHAQFDLWFAVRGRLTAGQRPLEPAVEVRVPASGLRFLMPRSSTTDFPSSSAPHSSRSATACYAVFKLGGCGLAAASAPGALGSATGDAPRPVALPEKQDKGEGMRKPRRDDALEILRRHKAESAARYGVTPLGIFGSVARDEAATDNDVDVDRTRAVR